MLNSPQNLSLQRWCVLRAMSPHVLFSTLQASETGSWHCDSTETSSPIQPRYWRRGAKKAACTSPNQALQWPEEPLAPAREPGGAALSCVSASAPYEAFQNDQKTGLTLTMSTVPPPPLPYPSAMMESTISGLTRAPYRPLHNPMVVSEVRG